jgi:hypothetical protein
LERNVGRFGVEVQYTLMIYFIPKEGLIFISANFMAFESNCTGNYHFKSDVLHSESTVCSTQKYIV